MCPASSLVMFVHIRCNESVHHGSPPSATPPGLVRVRVRVRNPTASPLYHIYVASLAAAVPAAVVSVDYRLAPEHCIPAAYDDTFAALKVVIAACRADGAEAEAEPSLAAHGDVFRIVLAGDSAGGNMAHNVAIRLRKEGGIEGYDDMVSGGVLLYPYF
eukprot:XP_020406665.1 tuliposide A-converting enzyme 2, chloroplastic-like [Zea mays]